jgi:ferredoxin
MELLYFTIHFHHYMAKVTVIPDKCVGCGMCAQIAPTVFEMTDDFVSKVKKDKLTAEELEQVEQAKEMCPTGGILIEED